MGVCIVNKQGPIDLGGLCCLEDVSWIGLWGTKVFATLAAALRSNKGHLKRLEVDLVSLQANLYEHGVFNNKLLGLPGRCGVLFPTLTALSLSSVSLRGREEDWATAMQIKQLSSLTLRNCPGWERLYSQAWSLDTNRNLSSLEIVHHLDIAGEVISTLETSFLHTPHLRDLFISLNAPGCTLRLWSAIAKHQKELTRFVYHQMTMDFDSDSEKFHYVDDLNLSLSVREIECLNHSGAIHPFAGSQLRCLGLGYNLEILVQFQIIRSTVPTTNVY